MTARVCSIPGCGRGDKIAKSLCGSHYDRLRKHGDPTHGGPLKIRNASPGEAILLRTEPLVWSDCLVWTGHVDRTGYGRIEVDGGRPPAHRYAWEAANGAIPEGYYVDHTCHEKSCVNVDHLRLATAGENSRNRRGANLSRKDGLPRNVYAQHGRYRVRIVCNRVANRFGTYDTPEEAAEVAARERKRLFGEFAGNG